MLDLLIQIGAIKYNEFILSSGERSNFYLDIKQALLDHRTNKIIIDQCFKLIKDVDSVAGIGLGGTLLVSSLIYKFALENMNINGIIVREKIKEYGTKMTLEGTQAKRVVLVEDVITTGQSCKKAIQILNNHNIVVTKIVTVVNRQDIDSINDIEVKSLLSAKDI